MSVSAKDFLNGKTKGTVVSPRELIDPTFRKANAEKIGGQIVSRVNTWLKNSENYVNNFKSRYETESDAYRGDSEQWLSTVTEQKIRFDAEAENIKNLLKKYGGYFTDEWKNSIISALDGGASVQSKIVNASTEDRKYWSQWADEASYNEYLSYQKMFTEDTAALQKEIDDLKAKKQSGQGGDSIDAEIEKKEAYLKTVKYLQSIDGYNKEARSDTDFDNIVSAAIEKGKAEPDYDWWVEGLYMMLGYDSAPNFVDPIIALRSGRNRSESNKRHASYSFGVGAPANLYESGEITERDTVFAENMSDDEFNTYAYYYGKYGKEKADEYLDAIEYTVRQRAAGKIVDAVGENYFAALIASFGAGIEQFGAGLENLFSDKDYYVPSEWQMASGEIRGKYNGIAGVGYDLSNTVGNMLPSIMTSMVIDMVSPGAGSVVGSVMMGASAAGNAKAEMLNLGYSKEQATAYGVAIGISEGLLQYALGGISKLGGKVSGNVIGKALSQVDNAIARAAIQLGGQMLSEGAEEAIQSVLEPIIKSIVTGEDIEAIDWGEVAYSGLLGALSAGLLEGGSVVTDTVHTHNVGKGIKNTEGAAASLADIGKGLPKGSVANRLANKVNENTDAYTIGRLYREVGATLSEQNRADIVSGLMQRGLDQRSAEKLARQYQAFLDGEMELTDSQIAEIENSAPLADVLRKNIIGRGTDVYKRSRAFNEFEKSLEASADTKQSKVSENNAAVAKQGSQSAAKMITPSENAASTENAAESKKTASEATEKREITLAEASKKYGAQAGAMLHTYREGQNVARYDSAYSAAYEMGKGGVPLSYAKTSAATAYLTEEQRSLAYEAGQAAADGKAQKLDSENKSRENGKKGRKRGTVKGEGVSISDLKKTFNDTQNTAYKLLSTYAEATGVDIVLYRSEADESGKFTEAQGRFSWSEDKIYIDINAGMDGERNVQNLAKYTMMRTFSHEFTHFIEKWNPIWYNEFRRAVFDELTARGENVDELIDEKLGLDSSGKMSYDMASREVVAEAMTDILPDTEFLKKLCEDHKNIFEKLLSKLREFIADLKAHFNSLAGNPSREANALKTQVDGGVRYLESIAKAFDKVALQAIENYQKANATDVAEEHSPDKEAVKDQTKSEPQKASKADSKPTSKKPKIQKTKKSDWASHDVEWYIPGKKSPIAYSTVATSDLIVALADLNSNSTIEELKKEINYDEDAKKILQIYIDAGYGNQMANEWLFNKKENENVDNERTVSSSAADRQGNTRLLDEGKAEDVPRDARGGDSVGEPVERGVETRRESLADDSGSEDVRGSGDGDSSSRDLRRADELTEKPDEDLHNEVSEQILQQSTETPRGKNFTIGDSLDLPNGEKARYKANIEAIRLIKKLESEKRFATAAEQKVLSKYVGWGGLSSAFDERKADWSKEYKELRELLSDEEYTSARGSTLNAHYTDISVIKAMYDGLSSLGFKGGRVLEPAAGVGHFIGAMPKKLSSKVQSVTMVELDGITGLISKYLYPNADVRIQGFETANIPNNYMDIAISNVPFGNYPVTDRAYPKKITSAIHNYFFAKSLDKVRPGGLVVFITSSYTMNAKDETVRRYIMQRADLLGAIRLPDTAFLSNAGTSVVTDILVLKKRKEGTEYAGEDFLSAPWTYPVSGNYSGANINTYFTQHPEMVLGTPEMTGSMYRGNTLTYKAFEGQGTLDEQIRRAFKNIKGKMDYPAKLSPEKTNFAVQREISKTKENGYLSREGKIYKNIDGKMTPVDVPAKTAQRIDGMLSIRDAARDLLSYQQQGVKDSEIKKARERLNRLYDEFVKKHGYLNSPQNKSAFSEDPDKFSLFALENYDPDTKKATKSDVFSKNTVSPNRTVTAAKDIFDGLIVSINQTGGVDTELIARLTGRAENDVSRELIASRRVFKDRDGELVPAETYLSGNVRAKLRDAEALLPIDKDYQNNIDALRTVIPENVTYGDIFVNPGTPWIPNSVYSDFAAHILGGQNSEWRQDVDITRNADTGNFSVELKSGHLKYSAANTQKWGTSRRSFVELFDAMLNSRSVVVKDKLSDGSYVVNRDETAAANEKIENIQKEFSEWLWKDEGRRTELETLYNEVFNAIVTPKYSGDNLTVNGANAAKPLRPHQRDAVARIISSGGNTLLAHRVGAGKTYEMAAAAMKLRELGLVKKPMFAVPKSLVAQWGTEFKDFFPTAKLFVAESSDFAAANRKVFMNRIANGEYDAVIVSYEQFEKLPMSDAFTKELYEEQINSIVAAIEEAKAEKGDKALSVKDLEKKRKSLQAKIDKLTDKAKDDGNIDFEQLGVDSLFIDEAHNFKNLFYTTSMTNVAGLGNKDGSKRAFDLYTKVRYLQKLNGGRGIVFATATPVMNSMSEMYIMQKYLQPDLLESLGLSTFDAWAKQFGEIVNGVEIKPSGQGYRVKQSFSRFKNLSELQLLFRNFADVLTEIPGLKIPKMKGGAVNVVVCEPGQFQTDYMAELEKRADNIKNVDPSVDNMLKITSDGRKISYTQRMIDPTLPYEDGCKIYRCADNVIRVYNESSAVKGTQLIFCDMATPRGKSRVENEPALSPDEITDTESAQLYDDIKARLVLGGVPAGEIAFIHEADTDQKKKKLFADVNDGRVRVLIGSTGKMGVGMNAQRRVVAIHHLDAPWRPGDVEQRNGRAYRQGNINAEVECFTYVTEGSFDARLWDILERKQNFINQIMNGESVGREAEDTGEITLSAAEVKALASGSPLILEQVQLETDIKKLESLYRSHRSAVRTAAESLEANKSAAARLEGLIENGKSDMLSRKDTYSDDKFKITVGKQIYTDKKDAGAALMAAATAKATGDGYTSIGSFAGFDLRVVKTSEGIKGAVFGRQGYAFKTYPSNTTYMINHIVAVVESIEEKVNTWAKSLEQTRADIAEHEKLINEPFSKQAELDEKRARYREVMELLSPKEEQSTDSIDEGIVQEQSREYLNENEDGNADTTPIYETFENRKSIEPINFKQLEKVRDLSDKKYNLSETQSRRLRSYIMCAKVINSKMRLESITEQDRLYVNELAEAIKKFPAFIGRTYRNLKFQSDQEYNDFLRENTNGNIVMFDAFTSTSKIPNGYPLFGKYVVHMVIDGVSGRDIADVYGLPRQQEVLFLPGLKYVVNSVSIANDGKPIIFVKEIVTDEVQNNDGNLGGQESGFDIDGRGGVEIPRGKGNVHGGVYVNGGRTEIDGNIRRSKILDADAQLGNDKEQHQQRTNALSDREVLELAASEIKIDDLTEGEREALQIFRDRLSKLSDLQDQRVEQGRLYREQQFGTKPNRAEAEKALNRMRVLDSQIQKAEQSILSIEDKKVLRDVLVRARRVVEKNERAHGLEILRRYRDRRNNAAQIKKYRERIQKDVSELSSWVLSPDNKDVMRRVPDVLKNTVIDFISGIDFTSKKQLAGHGATIADASFTERIQKLNSALRDNLDINGLYSGYTDLPPNFTDRLQTLVDAAGEIAKSYPGERVINKMTSEELAELSGVVRALKKYIMYVNSFHQNAIYSHVYEAGDSSISFMDEIRNAGEHTGGISNFVLWQQMRPAFAFERFGDGGRAIFDELREGQATLAFNTKKIQEFAQNAYTEKEVKAFEDEIREFSLGGDIVKMPVSAIMSLYELSKDPEAKAHLLGGGIRVATYTKNGKKISDIGHSLSPADLANILSTLTDRQKEIADNLQKYMAEQGGAWGNHVSLARFGEELFTNKNYFPINSDGRHLQATADEYPSAAALYALLNMSFTKSRKEGAQNRVIVYSIFDVFANHMASMAQYNAMALPILDALKWFNYRAFDVAEDGTRTEKGSVREQMTRVYGVPDEKKPGSGNQGYAEAFVANIIKAFNGTEAQGTPTDTFGTAALRRYNMAQVAFNLRVVMQQPLAITRAALLVDYQSIVKGMKNNPAQNIAEMEKYSGIAAWKSLGFYDVNISRGLTHVIKHDSSVADKIGDVGMWGAEKADLLTWAGIWSACKEDVTKKQGLSPKDKGFFEAVTRLFEDVVYKTQVVDSVLTKNEYMRSKGFFARAVGSFMSEPTTTASMLVDAYDKYSLDIRRGMSLSAAWKKNGAMIGRVALVYGVSAVMLAAVQAVADAFRDDDDYEEWYEKWLEAFGGNLIDELMPINKLPILNDFYELGKELLSLFGVDTYGNPPQSVFMQWYDSLIKGVEILTDKIAGEDTNYTYYGAIYKLLQAASGMTGLPMAAVTREVVTAFNNTVGAMAPSLKIKPYEPSELSEIKYAYADGYLTDEEATALLLEKGLCDNENEAYFIIQGWEVGDGYSRYDSLYDAVRNGGDFDSAMDELTSHGVSEKEAIARVKSKIGEWYKKGEITKVQAVSMLEKYSGMNDKEINATVSKWSSTVVVGIDYDEIDDEFFAGNITASRAVDMYVKYGSMTREKATEKVEVLQFVKDNPSCDGISSAAVKGYKTYCEPNGVDPVVYYEAWLHKNSLSGEVKEQMLDYIDSLDLSKKQKDSLYYAFGWAKSTIKEAPWR